MPIDPKDLRTGGALQGAVAASLLREREAAAELLPGARIGIYRVLHELARGGMAIVYLAARDDGEYQQQVALKWMLQAQPDAASEALFRRERQALADLRHPHIARLLDGGRTEEGRPWLAMELIQGEPLDRHCVQAGLRIGQRLTLFQQVCAAVAFAHARGVIHRDIKPSNVMVDADGSARLLDFGIAQLLGQEDAAAVRAFTPGFASPEQCRGDTLTVASDVYQLGRLLASLLSRDASEQASVTMPVSSTISLGSDWELPLPRQIDPDLGAILRKATATDPAQRYPTADALSSDIQACIERRPVAARRRSAGYVAARYVQRHPVAVAASIAAILALVLGTLFFTQRLRVERDAASYQARAATAVLEFLNQDLLDAANPRNRVPNAPDMTVREALRVAEGSVDRRFGTQPEIAASVLATLAELQYQFGDFDVALGLIDRATRLPLRPDSPEVLQARLQRGVILTTINRFDEAEPLLGGVVADAERVFGPGDRRTLEYTLRLIENSERRNPDMSQAPRLAALRERANAALGEPNAIAGEADYLISDDARMLGTPLRAAAEARRALATLTAVHGPDHPSTLKAKVTVAGVQFAEGAVDDALESLRAAHRMQVSRYGPDVLDSLFMQNELGLQLIYAERYAEARGVIGDLLTRRERVQGMDSEQLIPALSNLGNVHLRLEDPAAALASFERCAAIIAAIPDTPRYMMASVRRGQADALRELGRLDEAEAALEAGDAAAAQLAEGDLRRFTLQGSRARLLLARGMTRDGLKLLDATIAVMKSQVSDGHPYLKPLLAAAAAARSDGRPLE